MEVFFYLLPLESIIIYLISIYSLTLNLKLFLTELGLDSEVLHGVN